MKWIVLLLLVIFANADRDSDEEACDSSSEEKIEIREEERKGKDKKEKMKIAYLPSPTEVTEVEVEPTHKACPCNISNVWIDMVFIFDASGAVSQQDFIAISNLLRYFFSRMTIGQALGQYARVGLVFGAEEAYVAANLTTFASSNEAVQRIKKLMEARKKLPIGKGLQFDVGLALIEAKKILHQDGRINRPVMVILFSATEVMCYRDYSRAKSRILRTDVEDPCRIAAGLTEGNNVLTTVALKFGKLQRFPRIDIATPCFNITNSINLPANLLQKICDANCFCPPPYMQYKDKEKCIRHSECIYLLGIALSHQLAVETCADDEATLVDIFDENKNRFITRVHDHGNHTPYWIGLKEHRGKRFWATGTKLRVRHFTKWAPGEPSGKGSCTVAESGEDNTTFWRAEECDDIQSKYFSCQKQACDTTNYCAITPEENTEMEDQF